MVASRGPIVTASIPPVSLELAGLVALAELATLSKRTAMRGTDSYLDTFVICPGLHREQWAPELNKGEYPAAANILSDYVFRIENPGTVVYLQRISRTGSLTTVKVSRPMPDTWLSALIPCHNTTPLAAAAYALCIALSITILVLMGLAEDWWGVFVVGVLGVCRLLNVLVMRRRARQGWSGKLEPGVEGELFVLMSQDRWVRIRGMVDDIKAVTSGQWLADMTPVQGIVVAAATVLMYVDAALASNLQDLSKILLIVLLIGTAGLLEVTNAATNNQIMHKRILEIDGERKEYNHRLVLAKELLHSAPTKNWAKQMALINEDDWKSLQRELDGNQEARPEDGASHIHYGPPSDPEKSADMASDIEPYGPVHRVTM